MPTCLVRDILPRPCFPSLLTLWLGALSAPAQAPSVPIAITNPGFEAPPLAPGTFATLAAPPGWTGFGPLNYQNRTVGALHPGGTLLYPGGAPEGQNVGVVFLLDQPGNQQLFAGQPAGLAQDLGEVLLADTRYTLRVLVGNLGVEPQWPHGQFQFAGFPGYRLELLAGGVVVASEADAVVPAEGTFVERWLEVDIGAGHAALGAPLSLRLGNSNAASGIEVNFDAVRLERVEIAAWSDLGHALAGSAGVPRLRGAGPLVAGSVNRLDLDRAAPGAVGLLVLGLAAGNSPLLGGVLVPAPLVTVIVPIDAEGRAVYALGWPSGVPAGVPLHAQVWLLDPPQPAGVAASNGLLGLSR